MRGSALFTASLMTILCGCGGAPAPSPPPEVVVASPPPAPEVASSASASKSPPPAAHVAGPKLASLPGTSIRFDGGDGSAKDKAIKILGAKGEQDGVAAEYQYLDAVFGKGSWKPKGQSLLEEDGRKIDAIDFVRDGHDDTLYFDISDYFGKF